MAEDFQHLVSCSKIEMKFFFNHFPVFVQVDELRNLHNDDEVDDDDDDSDYDGSTTKKKRGLG